MNANCMLRYKVGRLMFNQTPDPNAGGGTTPPAPNDPPAPPADPPADLGFPQNTPVAEMTDAQASAYWRNESKKQQKIAEARKDYDAIKAKHDEFVAAHATDDDKKTAAAKAEGIAEAEARLLRVAVRGELRALTNRPVEDVDKALEFIDVTKFTTNGELDDDKLEAFATTLGTGAGGGGTPPSDPVRAALERQQKQGGGAPHGGSIAALQALEHERLTKKQSN